MKSRNSLRRRRLLVCCLDLASRHVEGGKQRRRTVALVVVAMSRQCASVRQLQIALRALERLDRWFFVDAQNDRVLRRRQVETDNIGGLVGELWVVALAPALATARSI